MERTTHELKTQGGHTVVLFDYITGKEARTILSVSQPEQTQQELNDKVQDKAIEVAVRSLDGSSENLVERVGGLPFADYAEVVQALTELLNPKKKSQA